jgi:predicted phage terminase large subunit-like protein
MTATLDRLADHLDARANPPEAVAMDAWYRSDCGNSGGCATCEGRAVPPVGVCPACARCASCAACRPEQRTPGGKWRVWLMLGGRGSGKTRPGAEDHCAYVAQHPGVRANILAPTFADARDTCVEGESGILATYERYGWRDGVEFTWNRSIGEINYINGSKAKLFSAEKPSRLRGPQHHRMWVDELAQVLLGAIDAWDMMKFGLRLGRNPQVVATTTPLPMKVIKDLVADPKTHVTRMRMVDNLANLAPEAVEDLLAKYGGTLLGQQELDGEILAELPGALFKQKWINDARLGELPGWYPTASGLQAPFHIIRSVLAVDPAVGDDEGNDETGIMVVGLGNDGHYYVLEDCTVRDDPDVCVRTILAKYDEHGCNEIVVEINNGGKWIPGFLRKQEQLDGRTSRPANVEMITAKQGKVVRAETPSNLYAQGRVHHVGAREDFQKLEDQLVTWLRSTKKSPDRLDAVCYGILHLANNGGSNEMYKTQQHIPRHTMPTSQHALSSANNLRR